MDGAQWRNGILPSGVDCVWMVLNGVMGTEWSETFFIYKILVVRPPNRANNTATDEPC